MAGESIPPFLEEDPLILSGGHWLDDAEAPLVLGADGRWRDQGAPVLSPNAELFPADEPLFPWEVAPAAAPQAGTPLEGRGNGAPPPAVSGEVAGAGAPLFPGGGFAGGAGPAEPGVAQAAQPQQAPPPAPAVGPSAPGAVGEVTSLAAPTEAPSLPQDGNQASLDLVRRGPEAVAAGRANLDADRREFAAAERQRRETENARAQAEEADIFRRAQATAQREIAALQRQVAVNDREHAWAEKSTPQQIGTWIYALTSGLFAAYHGGKNEALTQIFQSLDNDVEVKRRNLNAALEQQGQTYANALEEFRMAEANRLANYARLDKEVAAKAAQYDPKGTRAQELAEARLDVRQRMAEKEAAAAQRMHEMALDEEKLNLQKRQIAESAAARRASQSEQRADRVLQAKKAGFIYDAAGNLVADPNAAQVDDPSAQLARLRGERVGQEIQAHEEGRIVQDKKARPIGVARYGPADGQRLSLMVGEYESFRQQSVRLKDLLEENETRYGGIGSGRWPAEATTAVNAIKGDLAVRLAKIRDPESVAREGEVAAAAKTLPEIDAWTTSKNPKVAYRELMRTADQDFDARLGARIIDWDARKSPTVRYQAIDKVLESDDVKAETPAAVQERALTPISNVLRESPEVRAAAIEARGRLFNTIGDRGGLSSELATKARAQLDAELAAGDLSQAEHNRLSSYLESNALVRPPDSVADERQLDISALGRGKAPRIPLGTRRPADEEDADQ